MNNFLTTSRLIIGLTGLLLISSCRSPDAGPVFDVAGRRNIAYWHNWHSTSVPYLPLTDVPSSINTLIVAFATPVSSESGRMIFKPEVVSEEAFLQGVKGLQSRGIQVLISVGGGNHLVELDNAQMLLDFIASMKRIIDRYGFDGMDINLEGGSKVLDPGDTDFKHPRTPKVRNMIQAVKNIKAHYGPDFVITVAPETQYTVAGYHKYGGAFGGYLPFLDALREEIDVIHLQLYNSGSQYVYDGDTLDDNDPIVEQGTVDFVVGLTEMMILGFPVARDESQYFEGFGAEKIAVGLPASQGAGSGGALSPEDFRRAMGYLMTGVTEGNSALRLRQAGGYPGLNGVMTWSLNWDALAGEGHRPFSFVTQSAETLREHGEHGDQVPLK